jgi:hypothetical protein
MDSGLDIDIISSETLKGNANTKEFCIVRDITPHRRVKVNRRFGGTQCLHSQDRSVSQAGNPARRKLK